MVDLYTILKLIDIFDKNDCLVYLRSPTNQPAHRPEKIMTVKEIKEKYDLRKVKVVNIRSYFCWGDYKGFLLTIAK